MTEAQYGTAVTRTTNRTGTGTMAHIIKMNGKALCGVKLDPDGGTMTSLAGWNLCARCERASQKAQADEQRENWYKNWESIIKEQGAQ